MSLLNYSAPYPAASSSPPYYQPLKFQPHQSYQPSQNNFGTYYGSQGPYNAYSFQQRQQTSAQGQAHTHVTHQVSHPQQNQVPNNQQFHNLNNQKGKQIPAPNTRGQIPEKPPGYTRVDARNAGSPGTKTQVHAVIDYDEDFEDYYDDIEGKGSPHVTPIQGPIFLKNGTVPVVPLFSYPQLNNGSFIQIPILWTALSVALGIEIRGEIIRGVPCIKRYHQLFCPTAGTSYPFDRIELFIDENKALMKRMYGDFQMGPDYGGNGPGPGPGGGSAGRKAKRSAKDDGSGDKVRPGVPDLHAEPGPNPSLPFEAGDSYFSKLSRRSRQAFRSNQSESGRLDACESKTEIVTPYWASNSAGKIRAIVNTQHFEQAIHQEVCSRSRTGRCSGDCGCEQKYKWHRLLAYDPDNDCKGIFMDWFLFPSCCVCRCNPT